MEFCCRKCGQKYKSSFLHELSIDPLCPDCKRKDEAYTERAIQAILNLKIAADIKDMPKEKVGPFLQRLKEEGIDVSYFEKHTAE